MSTRFIALDIHKHYLVVGAVNHQQHVVLPPHRQSLKAFPDWAQHNFTPQDHVVWEATTNAWLFCHLLEALAGSVTVAHPLLVKLITSAKVKTDARDTLHLAQLLAANLIPSVWIPPKPVRELRALVNHRQRQVRRCTQLRNRLQSVLHRHNLTPPDDDPFHPDQRDWWHSLPIPSSEMLMVRHNFDALMRLIQQKTETETELGRLSFSDPWLQQMPFLMQIPGIGLITAMTLLAAIGDITRFPSAKHLVGYRGLGSSVHHSGQVQRTDGITKQGRREIRYVMIEAAWSAVRYHPRLQTQFAELKKRIGKRKAIAAMARKLLVVVWHVLTKHEVANHVEPQSIARTFFKWGADYRVTSHLGIPRLLFVQQQLDQLGLGQSLTAFQIGKRRFVLLTAA